MNNYPIIHDLLSPTDKVTLQELSSRCKMVPGIFVEIGSYYGASATLIMTGAKDSSKSLFCFDFFEPEKAPYFSERIRNEGLSDRVHAFAGNFVETLPPISKQLNIAFAFVDHSHTFEDTQDAWDLLWPRMSPGGIIAFHDYGHTDYPGGTEFLTTIAAKQPHEIVETIIVFQKPS